MRTSIRTPLLALTVLTLGCRDKAESTDTGELAEEEPAAYSLALTVDSAALTAGDSSGYSLTLTAPSGEASAPESWVLASDLEPGMLWSADTLSPTVSGAHTLTATVQTDEGEVTAAAALTVSADVAYDLDLMLSDVAMAAGDELTWSVSAVDAYGNTVDASGAEVLADSGDVTVESGSLWGVVPGTYAATASLDELTDTEIFVVSPGAASSISLSLDTGVERYETVSAEVVVTDDYGNITDDDWTLTVDGDGSTGLSYRNITFYDEGWYTVTATVTDTPSLTDSVGPFLIDSTGPLVEISTPERGAWVEGDSGTITGTVTDDWATGLDLTVSGDTVTPDASGYFSTDTDYEHGLNIIETVAVDDDGNTTTDTRAVLAGDFLPSGSALSEGILVRIHEGSGGFDAIEEMGEGLISADDLDALIPSPVYSASSESCYDPCNGWFGGCEVCVTWYSVTLYVTNPSIGATDLDIDPTSSGTLDTAFTVTDPSLDWSASGSVTGISYSSSGDITADDIVVSMDLTPSVSSGNIAVGVSSVSSSASNFSFDMDSSLDEVLDFFGANLDGTIEGYMNDAIEDAVYDAVPDLMDDALSDLELSFSVDVLNGSYDISAVPEDIDVDNSGLTLSLYTLVDGDGWVHDSAGLGSLYGDFSTPTWTGSPGALIGISSDFLNQVLYELWGGGALDLSMSGEELGLGSDETELLGISDLSVVVYPMLPPVAVPGSSSLLDLQLGDLELTLYDGDPADEDLFMQVYVSAVADMDVSVDGDETLSIALGDMDLYFDVVYPEGNTTGAADAEALLSALVPLLLPSLTDALGSIEIPSIEGLTLSGISVGSGGGDDGYLTLGGDLQ